MTLYIITIIYLIGICFIYIPYCVYVYVYMFVCVCAGIYALYSSLPLN